MEKHIRTLGVLHIVYGSLTLLAGLAIFLILSGIGIALNNIPESEEMSVSVSSLMIFFGLLAGIVLLIMSLPGIIGGIGLLKARGWARIVILVVGFFDLLHIPLGTALGIYTIWVLFHPDTVALLRKTGNSQPPPAP
jgi:hypothetical protein